MRGCLIYIMQDRPTVVGAESETEINLVVLTFIIGEWFFIGPRCPWGPIYGSGCLSLSEGPF